MNAPPAHAGGGGVEGGPLGQPPRATSGAPQLNERPHGGIERAVREARQLERARQDRIKGLADGHVRTGPAREAADLALRAIIAHNLLELRDAGVRRPRRPTRGSVVDRVDHYAHGHTHVQLDVLAAHCLRRQRHGPRDEDEPERGHVA